MIGLETNMNTTIGAIALIGVVLAGSVAISLVAMAASHTGSSQFSNDVQSQYRHDYPASPWVDD